MAMEATNAYSDLLSLNGLPQPSTCKSKIVQQFYCNCTVTKLISYDKHSKMIVLLSELNILKFYYLSYPINVLQKIFYADTNENQP